MKRACTTSSLRWSAPPQRRARSTSEHPRHPRPRRAPAFAVALILAIALALVPAATGHAAAPTPAPPPAGDAVTAGAPGYSLTDDGWTPAVRRQLERLIRANRNRNQVAVFDWDNTSAARDIGDATVAQLAIEGTLTPANLPPGISPAFTTADGVATPERLGVYDYYEALAEATEHENDPEPAFNSYAWATQAMAGMTAQQVVDATARAFDHDSARRDLGTMNVSKVGPSPRPFLYPGMVELYGRLLQHGYRVYIVSASNVWTVRYMATQMNRALRAKFGPRVQLPLENVIGVGVLMRDRVTGRLFKDRLLVRSNSALGRAYRRFDPSALNRLELTTQVEFPVPGFWGKVANVMEHITRRPPFLVAGDSSGDFANLSRARNRLWIARLDFPGFQEDIVRMSRNARRGSWIVQPTLKQELSGFAPSNAELQRRLRPASAAYRETIAKSLGILRRGGLLPGFFARR